jgi:hypothetical protein
MTVVKIDDCIEDEVIDLMDCVTGWVYKFVFEGGNSSIWLCLDVEGKTHFVDCIYLSVETSESILAAYDPIIKIIPVENITITVE